MFTDDDNTMVVVVDRCSGGKNTILILIIGPLIKSNGLLASSFAKLLASLSQAISLFIIDVVTFVRSINGTINKMDCLISNPGSPKLLLLSSLLTISSLFVVVVVAVVAATNVVLKTSCLLIISIKLLSRASKLIFPCSGIVDGILYTLFP